MIFDRTHLIRAAQGTNLAPESWYNSVEVYTKDNTKGCTFTIGTIVQVALKELGYGVITALSCRGAKEPKE